MSGGFEAMGFFTGSSSEAFTTWATRCRRKSRTRPSRLILGGGDVMVAAPTGSGKTAAFSLPHFELVHEKLKEPGGAFRCQGGTSEKSHRRPARAVSTQDRDATLAVDGARCQSRSERWSGGRLLQGIAAKSGKYFFEICVEDEGLCRAGWATQAASLDLGTDKNGLGFGADGEEVAQPASSTTTVRNTA